MEWWNCNEDDNDDDDNVETRGRKDQGRRTALPFHTYIHTQVYSMFLPLLVLLYRRGCSNVLWQGGCFCHATKRGGSRNSSKQTGERRRERKSREPRE